MSLKKLNEKISQCKKCELCKTRINVVCGSGSDQAEIMFVGEAPGRKEDEAGLPFIGSAGKILDEMIESIKLKRDDVYIANVVKCRPPENRDPKPEEVVMCKDWLNQQIEIIKPKLIVLLGRHSMDRFLPGQKISVDHGKPKRYNGRIYYPVYHPAATLYKRSLLEELQKDFQKIPKIIKEIEKDNKDEITEV
ncbi:uracil-DNA glycosylase [Candidatus Parcubacteria bacterium]|nr:uracil-DNA glycosylase [Candidatus Parcubacteria bacterium]MCK5412802.1 uracil-DNA glycosylase [Candidatus Paceibacterota bacterium]